MISIVSDIDAGYSPNGLTLYSNSMNELEETASISPIDWGPKSATWINDNIVILKCDYHSKNKKGHYQIEEAYIKLEMKFDN